MILGIDLGYSSTKIIVMDKHRIIYRKIIEKASKPVIEKHVNELLQKEYKIERIALTGGKSDFIKLKFKIPIKKVPEIEAISYGGLFLAKKSKGLVVSCGTGTCITHKPNENKNKQVYHLGGTGVGGGTIQGFAKTILLVDDIKKIEQMSLKGILSRVDLLIGDIVGSSVGILPKNITASNFGKAQNPTTNDLAKGILNLVAETISSISVFAAKSVNEKEAIIVGRVPKIKFLRQRMKKIFSICHIRPIFPEDNEYASAIGAVLRS